MPEEATDEPRKLDLSTVQVAASALAAVSAAVFASWFGTAGTLIGAALGSVVATVASATYSYSLRRTAEIARRKAAQVRETGGALRASLPRPKSSEPGPDELDRTQTLPAADEQADEQAEGPATPWWKRLDPRGKDLPWVKLGVASAAVMVVAMVVLTSFEGLTGRSLSSFFGNDEPSSTTVGNVFSGNRSEPTQEPTPEQAPSESPSESPSQAPSSEPTDEPSESPSEEPTETEAPVPTPTPTLPTTPTPSEDPGAAGSGSPTPSPSS